jgi:TolA-binding protein
MTSNVKHANEIVGKLKQQHQEKIEEMQKMIDSLQNEIKILQDFQDRLDDL